jgi:hypothetical protein
MRLRRAEPQGRGREPVSQGGTASGRDVRQVSAPRAPGEPRASEACQGDALGAVWLRVPSAPGRQEGRGGGLAEPGPRPQALVVRARGPQRDGLGEPPGVWGQSSDQVIGAWSDRQRVEALGGMEPAAGGGQGRETGAGLRTPRPAALAGLPRFQQACAAVAPERRGSRLGWSAAPSGRWRQVLPQGRACRQGAVEGRSPWMAEVAEPFWQRHSPWPQPRGRLQCRGACDGQQKLPLPEPVAAPGGIGGIRFPGALRPGLAMVPHGLAGHQADAIATRWEALVEGLPGETRGLQSAEAVPTSMVAARWLEGLCKTLDPRAGVRQGKFAAADAARGTQTGVVVGLAHIHANHEEVRLRSVRFTRVGIASILCQSHGTSLLV